MELSTFNGWIIVVDDVDDLLGTLYKMPSKDGLMEPFAGFGRPKEGDRFASLMEAMEFCSNTPAQ